MWWCLDEGNLPAPYDAKSPWVSDSVRFFLLALAAHFPLLGRGVELSVVLDVDEGFGSNGTKVREIGFLVVKHLERRLHLERLMRSPVLEVRRRHEQLPPHGPWRTESFPRV